MPSWVKALGTATVLAAMLAGCGVRGSLDAPAADKAEPTADASSGQGKPEGATEKPHKGFILDGLLR
jgi:predicted small lipoprotein YifL